MDTNDTCFDRLVDNELGEAERRELLGRLDDEPGGWRRCALAFLESQCWKQALGQKWEARETGRELAVPISRRQPRTSRLRLLSAMAASFLVALGLGLWARQAPIGPSGISETMGPIAKSAPPASMRPSSPSQWAQGKMRLVDSPRTTTVTPNPVKMVTVSMPSGDGPRPLINIPAVERDSVDQQWSDSMPKPIPNDVLQALARTGHQVKGQRQLLPVPLSDGRCLLVPVDRVEVYNGAF